VQEGLRKPLSALPKQPSSVESWLQVSGGVVSMSMLPREGPEGQTRMRPKRSHSKTPPLGRVVTMDHAARARSPPSAALTAVVGVGMPRARRQRWRVVKRRWRLP
jgi:hypothetical protein